MPVSSLMTSLLGVSELYTEIGRVMYLDSHIVCVTHFDNIRAQSVCYVFSIWRKLQALIAIPTDPEKETASFGRVFRSASSSSSSDNNQKVKNRKTLRWPLKQVIVPSVHVHVYAFDYLQLPVARGHAHVNKSVTPNIDVTGSLHNDMIYDVTHPFSNSATVHCS